MQINSVSEAQGIKAKSQVQENELKGFQSALEAASAKGDKQALKKAAQDLEQIFISMMMKSMRNTVVDSGLFEKNNEKSIYTDMLDDEYSIAMSRSGGIGLADLILEQYEKQSKNIIEK